MENIEYFLTSQCQVSIDDYQKALTYQKRNGGRLEQILSRMGALSSEFLPGYYSVLLNCETVTETQFQHVLSSKDEWQSLIKQALNPVVLQQLLENKWIPVALVLDSKSLLFWSAEPVHMHGLEMLQHDHPELKFLLQIITEEQATQLYSLYEELSEQLPETADLTIIEENRLRELASEAPTVNLLNNLIAKGLRRRASDMHIEPWKGRGRVRYRIDGVLQEADTIPLNTLLPVVTRLKLLSKMDIAEKRRPQDGKIEMRVDGRTVDIRVSALPVGEGESVVMRFLLQDALSYDIKTLGIEADIEQQLLNDLQSTSGVILMTGPTGSGKTTSLYSFLSRRNEPGVKIITIEDPIEYQLDGINQVQVQSDIGFTFANALRSVVRQDPDIIMVGEIRDNETAGIALQSALTGHLVFSTLHTNDAPSAYTRLLDLGVEPFLLSAAVKVVLAQRLVRQLCTHCSIPDNSAAEKIHHLGLNWLAEKHNISLDYRQAHGCEHCNHTGYRGRLAIIEYLRCDNELRELLGHSNFLSEAANLNRQRGYRNLLEDGALKAMRGQTSLEEVLRVAG